MSYVVSMRTEPKPDEELRGLVWSLTSPEERRGGEAVGDDAGWYRSPPLLGGGVLALTVVLYLIFG